MRTIEKKTLLGVFRFNKVFAVVLESINKNVADPFAKNISLYFSSLSFVQEFVIIFVLGCLFTVRRLK